MFNTCAVRENADNKLYGNLGHLRAGQGQRTPACRSPSAAAWRRRTAPPSSRGRRGSTSSSAPTTSARCRPCWTGPAHNKRGRGRDPRVARTSSPPRCRPGATRPTPAGSRSRVGLQQHLHVLHRPGAARQGDRTAAPATSWPRSRRWSPRASSRSRCSARTSTPTASSSATGCAFGKLLRACGEIEGLERVRFTSPHPAAFTDDVIAAMAETPNVMPSLHMPLQSGSDRVLKAMRRSYRSDRFLGILDQVRAADPRRRDHHRHHRRASRARPRRTSQQTLRRRARGRGSPARSPSSTPSAPGTPAATMADQVPKAVVQERYERLVARAGGGRPGRRTAGSRAARSRCSSPRARAARTPPPHRLSGRARDNRLVHFAVPDGGAVPRPGDVVDGRRHLRRAAPPRRRLRPCRRGLLGAPDPRRRRVGGPAGLAAARSARGHARHAVGRASGPRARDAARLRLTG